MKKYIFLTLILLFSFNLNAMDCLDNQKLLGVRADCSDEVSYKIYLDDVEGLDLKKVSNVASNSTGLELMRKAIKQGFELTLEDAINNDTGSVISRNYTELYFQNKFTSRQVTAEADQVRGISFEIQHPQKYQFSEIRIQNLYVKTLSNLDDAQILIITNEKEFLLTADSRILEVEAKTGNTVDTVIDEEGTSIPVSSLTLPNLVANETYSFHNLNFDTNSYKVEIAFDQTSTDVSQAYLPSTGCTSCGGGSVNVLDVYNGLKIRGGYGVSADVAVACDMERVKCFMLNELAYVARYRAVMYLIQDAALTDRMNFFAQNAQEDLEAFGKHISSKYYSLLNRKIVHLKSLLSQQDKNCFACSTGVKRGTIIV
ncbi:hypothetical protein WAF17_21165 [Bernardetia sp. ABR2-2B]|uniref:hypothetical protein n=1 Tax=Bernardetia sp. ABR2-2B TaxID=3127472 RepID=UPI0030CF094C